MQANDTRSLKLNSVNLFPRKLPDIRSYDNTGGFLCREETEFMELRKCYIKKSLEKLVNHDIDSKDVS